MRILNLAVANHLKARGSQHAHLFARLQGKDRSSGLTEQIGFWTGADHEDFAVEGTNQTFYGAGTIMTVNPIVGEAGLKVRTTRLIFSSVSPEVQLAVRGYDVRRQPCRLYIGYFDPVTHVLIGTLQRVFKGFVGGLEIVRPELGGDAEITVNMLSAGRALTKTSSLKKSNAALLARTTSDGFRSYSDVSGAVEAVWGENRSSGPPPPPPVPSYAYEASR